MMCIVSFVRAASACSIACWLVATGQSIDAQEPVVPKQESAQTFASPPAEGQPPRAGVSQLKTTQAASKSLGAVGALLASRCMACHGAEKQEGNYSVASIGLTRMAGDSEKLPIVAGKPSESELLRRLTTADESERMPAEADPLSSEQIELIQSWIADGAKSIPEIEFQPLSQWVALPKKHRSPEHYPTALPIAALALRPHAQTAFVSGYGEVIEWELETGTIKQRRDTTGTQIADIEVSRDGHYLAVSSGTPGTQGFVELWALGSDKSTVPLWTSATPDVAADIAFAPGKSRLAVGRNDGSLLVFDIASAGLRSTDAVAHSEPPAAAVHTFTPHADAILAVAWSDSGERLITASRDRTAKIFDARETDLIANYDRHQRAVGGVAYLGDNPVSFDETGQLRLWTGDDNDRTLAERDNLPRVLQHILTRGEQLLLPDGADLRVWTVERKTVPDGKDEAGKPKSKKVTRWSESAKLHSESRSWILSLSTSGDLIAAGTESGEVVVWQQEDSTPKYRFIAKP